MSNNNQSKQTVQGVLIDLAGVLYVGDQAIPGSTEAIQRLRDAGLAIRFITNTTRRTRNDLITQLESLGFQIEPRQVFSAPLAARRLIEQRGLRPYLLIHPDLEPEFADLRCDEPNAIVVGDAGEAFTYARLNESFRVLVDGGTLVAMGDNRYFKDTSGFCLDMGPYVKALEYAAGTKAVVVGKPSQAFFNAALQDIDCKPSEAVMIGDDLHSDIGGAMECGVPGLLVRTGKYRPSDEHDDAVRPTAIVDDLNAAVGWILPGG